MSTPHRALTGSKHAAKSSDLASSLLPTIQSSAGRGRLDDDDRVASPLRAPLRSAVRLVGRAVGALNWTQRLVLLTLAFLVLKVLPFSLPLPLLSTAPLSLPHPIPRLIASAEATVSRRLAHAPHTLEDAVARYAAQHHGRRPPKGYDAWFSYAVRHAACRVDGFGELYAALEPWWGVEPREVRDRIERVGAAGDGASALGRVGVREGRVVGWGEMTREGVGVGARDMEDKDARRALEDMLRALIDEGVHLPDGAPFFSLHVCRGRPQLTPPRHASRLLRQPA